MEADCIQRKKKEKKEKVISNNYLLFRGREFSPQNWLLQIVWPQKKEWNTYSTSVNMSSLIFLYISPLNAYAMRSDTNTLQTLTPGCLVNALHVFGGKMHQISWKKDTKTAVNHAQSVHKLTEYYYITFLLHYTNLADTFPKLLAFVLHINTHQEQCRGSLSCFRTLLIEDRRSGGLNH